MSININFEFGKILKSNLLVLKEIREKKRNEKLMNVLKNLMFFDLLVVAKICSLRYTHKTVDNCNNKLKVISVVYLYVLTSFMNILKF